MDPKELQFLNSLTEDQFAEAFGQDFGENNFQLPNVNVPVANVPDANSVQDYFYDLNAAPRTPESSSNWNNGGNLALGSYGSPFSPGVQMPLAPLSPVSAPRSPAIVANWFDSPSPMEIKREPLSAMQTRQRAPNLSKKDEEEMVIKLLDGYDPNEHDFAL
eukprot:TRINITY_DN427_c0_g1_i10.p1 TRINITY_DN427_c0_g1~~TRINITY_DN427_c0_g1_i10.p1  ORF type:complete len:161 (-),score=27.47 TRINITY_DN427_c0_g1_i10:605-1087(-)